jgi:hypothetical protein
MAVELRGTDSRCYYILERNRYTSKERRALLAGEKKEGKGLKASKRAGERGLSIFPLLGVGQRDKRNG